MVVTAFMLEVTICGRMTFKLGQHKIRYLYDVQHFQHHTEFHKESAKILDNVPVLVLY